MNRGFISRIVQAMVAELPPEKVDAVVEHMLANEPGARGNIILVDELRIWRHKVQYLARQEKKPHP